MKRFAFCFLLLPALAFGQAVGDRWSIQHQPEAATAATISKAAAANRRHIATAITVCVSATADQSSLVFNLRDGATGAGAIVWSARLMAPAKGGDCVTVSGLNIVGSLNTAMTLESAAAPAASNFATVSLQGYERF